MIQMVKKEIERERERERDKLLMLMYMEEKNLGKRRNHFTGSGFRRFCYGHDLS